MKPVTFFAFLQNAPIEKRAIECLSKFKSLYSIGIVSQQIDFLEQIHQVRPDILLLDLTGDNFSEIELLELIHRPPIVLGIISSPEKLQVCLEKGLFDTIPANFTNDIFFKKLYRVMRFITEISAIHNAELTVAETSIKYGTANPSFMKESDGFFAQYKKTAFKIKFEDVLVIRKEEKYVVIETKAKKTYFHESTLREMLTLLPEIVFVRINNSTIINAAAVEKMQQNLLYIHDVGHKLTRTYLAGFRKALSYIQS